MDKYDRELFNVLIEVQKCSQNFSKTDKIKINSWIKSLTIPTNNISWKKNRNLYSIKLLDNILNKRLEKPFTKYVEEGKKLEKLDVILTKSQLSQKINYINLNHSNEEIQNFINSNFLIENPIIYDINNKIKPNRIKKSKSFNKVKINKNNNNNVPCYYSPDINYEEILNNENNENSEENKKCNNFENNEKYSENKSDQLLQKEYFGFNQKLKNEPGFYITTTNTSVKNVDVVEKYKLQSTITFLENESKIKAKIIQQQNDDIGQLKLRVAALEQKIKIAFNNQK